jgi:1-acyl-sn-glycerol-3-phosphate acyltransferase
MLVIYPEGGIYRQDQVQRLKPGLARLALQAQAAVADLEVRIVPVDLYYSEAYPGWGCPVQVSMGEAITVAGYLNGNTAAEAIKVAAQELTQDLHGRLEAMVNQRQQGQKGGRNQNSVISGGRLGGEKAELRSPAKWMYYARVY